MDAPTSPAAAGLLDQSEHEEAGGTLAALHLCDASCTLIELNDVTLAPAEVVDALSLRSADFFAQDERAVLVSGSGDGADALAGGLRTKLKNTPYDKQEITLVALCLRAGFSMRGVRVAVQLRSDEGDFILLFNNVGRGVEGALSTFLRTATNGQRIDAQVYRTPHGNTANTIRNDGYWGRSWHGEGADQDYEVYRDALDELIEQTSCAHCAERTGLKVVELCAGDGTLAARLLASSLAKSIGSYTLIERNADLAARAHERLARHAGLASIVKADAIRDANAYGPAGAANVVIAAGSILNGQVGSAEDAEACLQHISRCLARRGLLIATGASTSWLHPASLARHGLCMVLQGSLASARTKCNAAPNGIEHGWERCQCLVVRRRNEYDRPSVLWDALAGVKAQ